MRDLEQYFRNHAAVSREIYHVIVRVGPQAVVTLPEVYKALGHLPSVTPARIRRALFSLEKDGVLSKPSRGRYMLPHTARAGTAEPGNE